MPILDPASRSVEPLRPSTETLARIPELTLRTWPRPLPRGAQPPGERAGGRPRHHRVGCRNAGYNAPTISPTLCPKCTWASDHVAAELYRGLAREAVR